MTLPNSCHVCRISTVLVTSALQTESAKTVGVDVKGDKHRQLSFENKERFRIDPQNVGVFLNSL